MSIIIFAICTSFTIFFQPKVRHNSLELNIYIMTLFLDDATATNSWLQAIGVKLIKNNVAYMSPMREQ